MKKMIAEDTRGKRTRKYESYENKDQMEHQEIVTPQWLVDELLSYVEAEGKTLDPCVGPGAFAKSVDAKDLTIMDIQECHLTNY